MNNDEAIERRIVTGLIVSTDFVKQIRPGWKTGLLQSKTAKTLSVWCIEYFDQYEKAPGKDIEGIYIQKLRSKNLTDEQAEDIEDILGDLSEEYERADKFNVDYLLDQTYKYFDEQNLKNFTAEIQSHIDRGDLLEAKQLAGTYEPILNAGKQIGIDFSDEPALMGLIEKAFTYNQQPIVKYPRQLGDFINDLLVRDSLVGIMGSEKRGKCLPGDQKVLVSTGEWVSIYDIIKNKRTDIISFDENSQTFVTTNISKFWENGVKDVYEITTKSGRKVQVTNNHPFLTPSGWLDLKKLRVGNFIAVPKNLPVFGSKYLPNHKIKLLAYFIAEGCLREYNYNNKNGVYKSIGFTSANSDIQKDFTACIHMMNCSVKWSGIDAQVTNSKINKWKHNKNYVYQMLKEFDLWNKLSYDKTIPNEIFKLSKPQISLFLRVLFSCDGWINQGTDKQVGFGVANEQLARQVHSLLTRFGIVSKLSFGKNSKRGSWTVSIGDVENIIKYSQEIGFLFKKQEKMKDIISKYPSTLSLRSFLDKFPFEIAKNFYNEVKQELGGGLRFEAGRNSKKSRFHTILTKAGAIRGQIALKVPLMRQSFIEVKKTETGKKYFNSPILWDEIQEIKYLGKKETFDLTIEKHHNFIAENIIVHNTFWLLEFAMRAVRQRANVAFFEAGDMSEGQLTRRISIYLAKQSDKEKYSGKMFQPVRDCILNQMDLCDKLERECDHGVFSVHNDDEKKVRMNHIRKEVTVEELQEKYKESPDYKPCYNCSEYWNRRLGAVWLKWIDSGPPLDFPTAQEAAKCFFVKQNRRFKLSCHPSYSLTVREMKSILDVWEKQDGFIPDMIVVDYPDILAPEIQGTLRDQENHKWAKLRGLSEERHCLVLVATQADAASYKKNWLHLDNFSEDKRKYGHVTAMIGLNQSPDGREKKLKMMRLNKLVVREEDFMSSEGITILQNLNRGQPYLASFFM